MAGARRVSAVAACLLALTACGARTQAARSGQPVVPPLVGNEPNGEQLKTGAQLLGDARNSLAKAATVHLTGTTVLQGVSTVVDVFSDRAGNVSGSLGGAGGALQVQLSKADDAVYVRPTGQAASLVAALGLPQAVASPAAQGDAWVLDAATAASLTSLTSLALPALTGTLLPATLVAAPALTSGDIDGTPVVTATASAPVLDAEPEPAATTVSVAVTGPARLVRLAGGTPGRSLTVDIGSEVQPALPTPAATPQP